MRTISLVVLFGILIIGLFAWSACQREASTGMHQRALSDSLERGYQRLQARYQQMGDSVPPLVRTMAGSMQQMHRQMMGTDAAGGPGMASQHRRMMRWHGQLYESAPDESPASSPSPSTEDVVASGGEAIYERQCATCHGIDGQGMAGTFPPLDRAAWVTGDEDRLVRVLLHGLQGPVDIGGTRYNGVMMAFGGRLNDTEIAAVLTYIRSSWSNQASVVAAEAVHEVREEYSGRRGPWSASELQ